MPNAMPIRTFSEQPTCLEKLLAGAGPRRRIAALSSAVALLLGALPGPPSHAQGVIEEIVVVAQKRRENLQDVPLSIAAFDRDALENRRIDRIDDVAQRVPNLAFSTFSSGRPEFTVRGIGTSSIARSALENSVIVFLDEVYVSRSSASLFELFDLEQVSVLRGPQGTLFGKNVVGGAISLTTSQPNADHWEAKLQAGYGNFDAREFKALISGPLSERVAGKFSFLKKDRDGFGKDLLSGRESDDQDVLALRGQALLDVAEGIELLLSADYHDSRDGSQTRSLVAEFDSFPPSAATGRERRTEHGHHVGTETEQWGLSARLNWRREEGSLTGIAAYREVDFRTLDQFGPRGLRSGQGYDDLFGQEERARQFSFELRYASEFEGPWNGVAGVYYSREKVDRLEFEEITVVEDGGVLNGSRGDWRGRAETDGWAAFADVTWQIHEALTARAGVRYTRDDKRNRSLARLADDAVPGTPFQILFEDFDVSGSESFGDVTPRAVLEARPFADLDLMAYLSWAEGFKSGGFDSKVGHAVEADVPVGEETATSFEIGLKSRWLGDSLQLNAAGFRTDFEDLQLITLLFDAATQAFDGLRVKNAGRASISGAELELTWLPAGNLAFQLGYGYLRARFDDFLAGTLASGEIRRDGNHLPNTPRHSINAAASYSFLLPGDASLLLQADYSWNDEQFLESSNLPRSFQDDYAVLNASVAWISPDERWKVSLWGKNLADELYADARYGFLGSAWAHYTPPRTYGVSVQWSRL